MDAIISNCTINTCNALGKSGLAMPLYEINKQHGTCKNEQLYGDVRCVISGNSRYYPMCRSTFAPGSINIGIVIEDKSTIERVVISSTTRDPPMQIKSTLLNELKSLIERLEMNNHSLRGRLISDAPKWMFNLASRHGIHVCSNSSLKSYKAESFRKSLGMPKHTSMEFNPAIIPLIESNTTLLMFPGISRRMVTRECLINSMNETESFLCGCRVSLGPSVGMSRSLVEGVVSKPHDPKHKELINILNYMCRHIQGMPVHERSPKCKCFIDGAIIESCRAELYKLLWLRRLCAWNINCPCVFVDWETYNYSISWCSGTLMKLSKSFGWYSNTERVSSSGFHNGDVKDLFSYVVRMVPFISRMDPKRINIGANFISQSICYGFYSNSRVVMPLYESTHPKCYSELTRELCNSDISNMPYVPALVGIMDDILVYEDGWIVSHSFAVSHRYSVCQKHWVKSVDGISIGTRIDRSFSWWKYYPVGKVISTSPSSDGDSFIVETRRTECISDGVKMCTAFGNKGVVTVVNDDEMPVSPEGKRLDIIIGSTTCIKRCSYAQLLAMNTNGLDKNEPKEIRCMRLKMDGRNITRRFNYTTRRSEIVRVNYGILDVLINFNTPCMRLNFNKTLPGMNGHSRRNDCSLGEMETIQILGSNGLYSIGKELITRGAGVRLTICNQCRILLGCICKVEAPIGISHIIINEGVLDLAKFKMIYEGVLMRVGLNGKPGILANMAS
ncbi:MAG: hypothetical protein AAFY41_00625 [Bacteroidota bacterium]